MDSLIGRLSIALLALASAARGDDRVKIPAGCFTMGCTGELCVDEQDLPPHNVCLDAYAVDRTEVTVEDYARCVKAGACEKPGSCNFTTAGRERHPINCVVWQDAHDYCEWAGGRLPTEAEWERAARGPRSTIYPWGDDKPDCRRVSGESCGASSTEAVGRHPAGDSVEGVSDLAGNVFELVADWYAPPRRGQKSPSITRNPRGPCDGRATCPTAQLRVFKGGAWSGDRRFLRGAARAAMYPHVSRPTIGFRCAADSSPTAGQ